MSAARIALLRRQLALVTEELARQAHTMNALNALPLAVDVADDFSRASRLVLLLSQGKRRLETELVRVSK